MRPETVGQPMDSHDAVATAKELLQQLLPALLPSRVYYAHNPFTTGAEPQPQLLDYLANTAAQAFGGVVLDPAAAADVADILVQYELTPPGVAATEHICTALQDRLTAGRQLLDAAETEGVVQLGGLLETAWATHRRRRNYPTETFIVDK